MNRNCYCPAVAVLGMLLCASALCPGQERVLSVGNEELRFVPEPQRGYVFKLAQRTGRVTAVGDVTIPDLDKVRPIRGPGRQDTYAVENAGPAARNQQTIVRLRDEARVQYAAPLFSSHGQTVAIIPEVVVHVAPGIGIEQVQALCRIMGLGFIRPLEFTTQEYLLEVLGLGADEVFAGVEELNRVEWIEWAAPDTALRMERCGRVFPNDQYFPHQWHLHNTGQSGGTPDADINAPEAWEITTGDPNIIVTVIDDGVDSNHPDLIPNLVPGYDIFEDDDAPDPDLAAPGLPGYTAPNDRHGTACAGLVAARGDNEIGVTGVAYTCSLMPIRVQFGDPNLVRQTMFAKALRWAAVHGADVLSNSWSLGDESPLPILHSAILDVTRPGGLGRNGKGCAVLFAAGNSSGEVRWPAKYAEVMAVGATDHNDVPTGYSAYGPELDITAPSGGGGLSPNQIWTTDLCGPLGYNELNEDPNLWDYAEGFSGTSAATPMAAGVAALVLSIEPNLTNEQVHGFVTCSSRDLGDPGWDEHHGWGRVDARAALDTVLAKRADLNDDWKVDEQDLAILNAAIDTNDLSGDIAPVKRDGVVDERDLELLHQYWQVKIREPFLLAHWALDEAEGNIAHDSVSRNHAELFGDPVWRPSEGVVGGALQLDGDDDFVGTEYVLDPSEGPFSVFAWINDGAPGQTVVSQLWGVNWLRTDNLSGYLLTELREPSHTAQSLISEVIVTDGDWHHVGLTWDGTNRILYVDDIEVAADTQPSLVRSVEGLNIGCGPDMTSGTFWSGLIDDVRIYNRAVNP